MSGSFERKDFQDNETSRAFAESEDLVNMDINFLTMESLILAQDERWRRASYMQVERELVACYQGKWRTGE